MADILIDGQIVLYGVVGGDFWDIGFTALDVVGALAQLGRGSDVTVRINSGGGIATEGSAIYSALKAHSGKVSVVIEGIAASAASIIAMAGADIAMRTGATMMIHDPSTITFGDAGEHQKSIAMLNSIADSMASIYAEKTARPAADLRAEMQAETWLTAEEAVAQGFADRLDTANANEPTAFNYRLYSNAPERIVALADTRGWQQRARPRAAAAAAQPPKETLMPEPVTGAEGQAVATATAAGAKAATDRIKAIAALDSRKGREALADHFAFETDMPAEAIDKALAAAPKGEAVASVEARAAESGLTSPVGLSAQAKAAASAAAERYNSRRK